MLKSLHVSAALLSVLGFLFRAALMLRQSPLSEARWVRRAPHYVDAVLLGAALGMVWVGGRQPFGEAWLGAKIGFLILYIGCGAMALKRARTQQARKFFLLLALLALANILSIAVLRDPWGLASVLRARLG